jgi:hypothetical protein
MILFIVEFRYFGIETHVERNCLFFDHVLFGSVDILIFNLSMIMGFRTYTVFNNMYEFAVKGNLPNKNIKRRNMSILRVIWIVSLVDLAIVVFMNIYWTFIDRNIYNLRIFNFTNRLVMITLIIFNAILFVFALNKVT